MSPRSDQGGARPHPILHIDIETRSTVSVKATGASLYAQHPDTSLWCVGWAYSDGPIAIWHPGDETPAELIDHVRAGHMLSAHNSGFERAIWQHILTPRYGWPETRLEQWDCTAARAAAMALPRSLEAAAQVLGLPVQKDMAGHRLMLRMARPRAVNSALTWWDDTERRVRLEAYCARDVEVERTLHQRLRPLSSTERAIFLLDAAINERGVALDLALIDAAEGLVDRTLTALNAELRELTGGAVTSVAQLRALLSWLNAQGPAHTIEQLDRLAIAELLEWSEEDLPRPARRALEIRAEAAKTSTAKLRAFRARACTDGRLRDNLMYHGASTGRWAGRGAQLQNLPRPETISDQDEVIALLLERGEVDGIAPPLTAVSEILRGVLIAAPGHDLIAADYDAIEARVLAWLAGEHELLQQFAEGRDPYREMAARIFKRPVDSFAKDSRERWIGKSTILGAGYQMGAARFRAECAKKGMIISAAEAEHIIGTYRAAHPSIVALWHELERAALRAVTQPGSIMPAAAGRARFRVRSGFLWLQLPSSRVLAYSRPRLEEREAPWGELRPTVTFMGISAYSHKWERQQAYGGRWTENITQATARDLLAAGMLRLEQAGYPVVLTIHDEVVAEIPETFGLLETFERLMAELPAWAAGCPVVARGWRGKRFRKG